MLVKKNKGKEKKEPFKESDRITEKLVDLLWHSNRHIVFSLWQRICCFDRADWIVIRPVLAKISGWSFIFFRQDSDRNGCGWLGAAYVVTSGTPADLEWQRRRCGGPSPVVWRDIPSLVFSLTLLARLALLLLFRWYDEVATAGAWNRLACLIDWRHVSASHVFVTLSA